MTIDNVTSTHRLAWNAGMIVGPKAPLKPKHIWEIRTRLKMAAKLRDLALFNLAIDSKLRGCDVVKLRISDVMAGGAIRQRSTVMQQKTGRPVPFELTDPTREALADWIRVRRAVGVDWVFPSRLHAGEHLTTRQYARLVDEWVEMAGLDSTAFGTHSLRRTKVAMIYKRTGNLRACQLLLGHTKLESTVRYLGIEADDALALSEQTEI
ncbi:MAG: tyrosine-type recombinase/integrase [Beijerinckiaceae bacterium]